MVFTPSAPIHLGHVPPQFEKYRIPIAQAATYEDDGLTIFSQRIRLPWFVIQFHIIQAGKETTITPYTPVDLLTIHYMYKGNIDAALKDAGSMPLRDKEYNMFWVPGKTFHTAKIEEGEYWCFHIDLLEPARQLIYDKLFLFGKLLEDIQPNGGGIVNLRPFMMTGFEQLTIARILSLKLTGAEGRETLIPLVNGLLMEYASLFGRSMLKIFADIRLSDQQLANITAMQHYLSNNLGLSWDLKSACEVHDLDLEIVEDGFEKIHGLRASEYYHNKRMIRAFELLGDELMQPLPVSIKIGYTDFLLFERDFKKYFGKSCDEIRIILMG